MKITIKQDEKKIMVCDDEGNVISKWTKELIEKEGGLDKIVERLKKGNDKLEVVIE